jgi:outer membrane protein OmpA-like peptidoglycan-associated protein
LVAKALVVAGQPANVEVFLEREAKPASLSISVHVGGKPIAAQVAVSGPAGFAQDQKLGDDGKGQLALPGAGAYTLKVIAEGYLATLRKLDVGPGAAIPVDVELAPVPKKSVLIITDRKITLRKQIHFTTGEATILPDSEPILSELLSVMLSKGIDKLRVEGHTDNVGGTAKNQKLSQDRADAVLQWLVNHGVAPEKLEAVGYGDSKPVAPNLTSRGRALNRRVEFDIL